jgi:hypothetical protein
LVLYALHDDGGGMLLKTKLFKKKAMRALE